MAKTLHQLLVSTLPREAAAGSSKDHDTSLDIIPRSPQELYEITCLVGELLPALPGDGVFAVDALLASPGVVVRDPLVWQWQDDRGAWHTYGYNDCRQIEAAFLAGEGEVTLASGGRSFTVNLTSRQEFKTRTINFTLYNSFLLGTRSERIVALQDQFSGCSPLPLPEPQLRVRMRRGRGWPPSSPPSSFPSSSRSTAPVRVQGCGMRPCKQC